jgi:hypothetical protein
MNGQTNKEKKREERLKPQTQRDKKKKQQKRAMSNLFTGKKYP